MTERYFCSGFRNCGGFKPEDVCFELVDIGYNDRVRVAKCPVCGSNCFKRGVVS